MLTFSSRIAALADTRPKLVALLLGLVSATGFAPLGLWPLALAALACLLALVARSSKGWRSFAIGWAFGFGHFALGLNWIATAFTYQAAMPAWLGWIAILLVALYLAVYPAIAAWGAWYLASRLFSRQPASSASRAETDFRSAAAVARANAAPPAPGPAGAPVALPYILAFAGLWTLTEWLRSWLFTGFAWNPLSAIQLDAAAPAIWIGSYGASALVILLAGAALLAAARSWRPAIALAAAVLLTMAGAFLWLGLLARHDEDAAKPVAITLVQPNIGQGDKWEGDKADANFAKLAQLTIAKGNRPRLILWPEAAIPDYLEAGYPSVYYDRSPAAARARLTELMNPDDAMLLGALKLEIDPTGEVIGARNAVMTIKADGALGPSYDKAHLVPYGEYLPLRPFLSAIGLSRLVPGDLDFWPGPGPRTIDLGTFGRAGLQVCYEIIFSGQVVDRAERPDFIFNPSNDAWFGAWGPPQHLAQARLRAIEEGLPVIRSTPTGISAVIDAAGNVSAFIPMHRAGRIDTLIPPAHHPTLFAQLGNILPVGFAFLLLALAIAFRRRGR